MSCGCHDPAVFGHLPPCHGGRPLQPWLAQLWEEEMAAEAAAFATAADDALPPVPVTARVAFPLPPRPWWRRIRRRNARTAP